MSVSFFVSLSRRFLIGFPHPRAGYFLLRGQKKVSKEKAARMPLASCAPVYLPGVARRGFHVPLATGGIHSALLRTIPGKYTGARRGIRGCESWYTEYSL